MDGVNNVTLMGSVGRDAEVKFVKDGSQQVAKFSLATNRSYKDKDGVKQTQTEWHNIELWGDLAKFAGSYVKSGDKWYVEGSLRYEKYTDKEGKEQKFTKIAASRIMLVAKANKGTGEAGEKQAVTEASKQAEAYANTPASNDAASANSSFSSEAMDDLPF